MKGVLGANLGFLSGCTFLATAPRVVRVGLSYSQVFILIPRVIERNLKVFWLLLKILIFGAEKENSGFARNFWVALILTIFLI